MNRCKSRTLDSNHLHPHTRPNPDSPPFLHICTSIRDHYYPRGSGQKLWSHPWFLSFSYLVLTPFADPVRCTLKIYLYHFSHELFQFFPNWSWLFLPYSSYSPLRSQSDPFNKTLIRFCYSSAENPTVISHLRIKTNECPYLPCPV